MGVKRQVMTQRKGRYGEGTGEARLVSASGIGE